MDLICHPETAWPDPNVIQPASDATAEQVALLALQVQQAEALAWTTYRGLTGNTVSICATTVRPIVGRHGFPTYLSARDFGLNGGGATPFFPTIVDGNWLNIWCGGDDFCECGSLARIAIPGGVAKVDSVSIDGVVLPASAYAVYDNKFLQRLDGEAWPVRQDWSSIAGEGVFEITYWTGVVPDVLDYMAVALLAVEFLKAIKGEKGCRLPSGATSIVRQGVSMQIEVDIFEKGLTGIREVDMVTARRNPNRLRTSPRVLAPGSRRARQLTRRV